MTRLTWLNDQVDHFKSQFDQDKWPSWPGKMIKLSSLNAHFDLSKYQVDLLNNKLTWLNDQVDLVKSPGWPC